MKGMTINEGVLAYERPLIAYAMTLTKNREDAQDLLQETSYKALKYKDKFQVGTNLKSWLYTIMRNIFINNYRKKKRRNTVVDHSGNHYILDSNQEINNEGERSILSQELNYIVRNLREDFKTPFLMAFEGYKYEEIAERLDVPLGTVKSRIFHARKILQQQISKKYQMNHLAELIH